MEIRVEVTTLLVLDDHPAELAGRGPVHADLARRLVRDQTAAEWRYAITDDDAAYCRRASLDIVPPDIRPGRSRRRGAGSSSYRYR